eukprot:12155_1
MASHSFANLQIGDTVEVSWNSWSDRYKWWGTKEILDIERNPNDFAKTKILIQGANDAMPNEWITTERIAVPGTHCVKYRTISPPPIFHFKANTFVYSNARKSIVFMNKHCQICEFDVINDTYSTISSLVYSSIHDIKQQKFVTIHDKNQILYMISGNDQYDVIEKYNLKTNELMELDSSSLKYKGNLQDDFMAQYMEHKNELHAITFDSHCNLIHYKYDEDQIKFVRLSEKKNIKPRGKLIYVSSLKKLILTEHRANSFVIHYAEQMKTNHRYKWKKFEFLNTSNRIAPKYMYSPVIAYDHILFSVNRTNIWCYDLFYGKIYEPIPQKLTPLFQDVLISNDEDIHLFDATDPYVHSICKLEDIVPLKLKQFYEERNDKLIFGFVRKQRITFGVPVVLIQCVLKYYHLFK